MYMFESAILIIEVCFLALSEFLEVGHWLYLSKGIYLLSIINISSCSFKFLLIYIFFGVVLIVSLPLYFVTIFMINHTFLFPSF